MTPEEWDDFAVGVVRGLLSNEVAVIGSELEAKICDRAAPHANGLSIDPHHVTNARKMLITSGELRISTDRTIGGHVIETLSLENTPISNVAPVAARKRAVQARFLGWAMGTQRHPNGLIGPAAERVLLASLAAAAGAGAGYRILPTVGRGVTEIFGQPVPGGPLDAAAFHLALDDTGTPTPPVLVPIEAKNIRSWIYPNSPELYQLLDKAAQLQLNHPDARITPTLMCRRGHTTLFRMAKHLGFYVIDARAQFVLPTADISDSDLEEVRATLGYDLQLWDHANRYITSHFTKSLPAVADRSSTRWRTTSSHPHLPRLFQELRKPNLAVPLRARLMQRLRATTAEIPGRFQTGW